MKNTQVILIIVSNIVLVAAAVIWLYLRSPKVAYVKIQSVYIEFNLKKELEGKIKNVATARKNILDSMEIKLKAMNLGFKSIQDKKVLEEKKEAFRVLSEEFYLKKKNFTEDNQRVTKDYEDQILTQLNQYIYEYGKEKGLDFIYGANGSGSMMYGSDKFDITEGVIKYVNERYAGSQK